MLCNLMFLMLDVYIHVTKLSNSLSSGLKMRDPYEKKSSLLVRSILLFLLPARSISFVSFLMRPSYSNSDNRILTVKLVQFQQHRDYNQPGTPLRCNS
jgi:hypothetical protein